ncbi:unnamed protein product [Oncorhynchus mykiss]|uniref:DUF1088 domain-containing protein n=1 Tax=Oncorhynchus mykiss TaxID=8022 RepID=A0A060ZBS6_ONCMY|nr:unnamed protein product [Oncorhynchus mykiss]
MSIHLNMSLLSLVFRPPFSLSTNYMSCFNLFTNLFYYLSQLHDFWRLDYWEDDLRRRRRFVRNPFGSTHLDVSLKALEDYGQSPIPEYTAS